jgi:hypothetical protein
MAANVSKELSGQVMKKEAASPSAFLPNVSYHAGKDTASQPRGELS